MANKQKIFIFSLLLLVSCHSVYYPGTNNISLLSSRYNGNISFNAGKNGFLLQNAFSPLNNLGIQTNFIYLSRVKNNISYGTKYGEFSLGYYNKFNSYNWEIYSGYGRGINTDNQDTAKIRKVFVQPQIGWQNDFFRLGVSSKISIITLKAGNIYRMPAFEPSFLLSMGYKHIFFNMQPGISFIPIHSFPDMKTIYFSISLGVNFKF